MSKQAIITALLTAAHVLTSCHQSVQKAGAEQLADSSETVTSTDTLQLIVWEKTEGETVVQAKL